MDTHASQKELTTLPQRCSQLAYWDNHHKRHTQHWNKDKSAHHHTGITMQSLVHTVSILNITRYTTQVNRCGMNTLVDAVRTTLHNINNIYNLTTSLATSINFYQMILHIRSVFANLCDSLNYIQMVSTHTMDYINAVTSGTLSPHVLPVLDLQRMLQHIADTLPPMLDLPISPEYTLHFYRYLHTHFLIENSFCY